LKEWFTAEIGKRQGSLISPLSFVLLLETVTETINRDEWKENNWLTAYLDHEFRSNEISPPS